MRVGGRKLFTRAVGRKNRAVGGRRGCGGLIVIVTPDYCSSLFRQFILVILVSSVVEVYQTKFFGKGGNVLILAWIEVEMFDEVIILFVAHGIIGE